MLEAALLAMAQTQAVKAPDVGMDVAASVASVAPGTTFHVVCTLTMPEGWHIYWRDPGDSGAPTEIDVTAPEGWTVGAVRYPTPQQLTDTGGTVNAYEDSATFAIPVTPPAEASPGSAARLGVSANWFVCRKVCFIGSGRRDLRLSVTGQPGRPTAAAAALRHLPRPVSQRPDTVVRMGDRSVLIGPIGPETRLIIETIPGVETGTPRRSDENPAMLEIPVHLEPDNSLGKAPRLRGLLVDGPGRYDPAWQIDLPVPHADDPTEDPKEDS